MNQDYLLPRSHTKQKPYNELIPGWESYLLVNVIYKTSMKRGGQDLKWAAIPMQTACEYGHSVCNMAYHIKVFHQNYEP
jgi:hypothetical protein